MFELAKDNKKVFEGLKQFEKTIKDLIESNKDKAIKSGKAKMFKSKSYLILKKGKLDELKRLTQNYLKRLHEIFSNIFKTKNPLQLFAMGL